MNKKGISTATNFLLGLVYTVIIILLFLSAGSRLYSIFGDNSHKVVIDSWNDDLNDVHENYGADVQTELLPITDLSENRLILVFTSSDKTMTLFIDHEDYILNKPSKCSSKSCICSYNFKKFRVDYCQPIPFYNLNYKFESEGKNKSSFALTNNVEFEIFKGSNPIFLAKSIRVSSPYEKADLTEESESTLNFELS